MVLGFNPFRRPFRGFTKSKLVSQYFCIGILSCTCGGIFQRLCDKSKSFLDVLNFKEYKRLETKSLRIVTLGQGFSISAPLAFLFWEVVQDVALHPWPLPTIHTVSAPQLGQPKVSPNIAKSPLGAGQDYLQFRIIALGYAILFSARAPHPPYW